MNGEIRYRISQAMSELEDDGLIRFPDAEAKAEFLDHCVENILEKFGMYERDPYGYRPDWGDEVLNMAELYDYTTEV